METINISYFSLIYLLILYIPIVLINLKLKIKINKKLMIAIVRMIIQLSLVGFFLQNIFKLDNSLLNFCYLILMITVAAFSAVKNCKLELRNSIIPIFIAFILPNIFTLLYFNKFIIGLDSLLKARYTIPIAGMLLGQILSGIIISVNNFYESIRKNEKEYIYLLSLSCSKLEAIKPFFKSAIQATVTPTIANMETIGLVALPGMMTGQILSGESPMTAIKYQIAIMLAIFINKYVSSILAICLTSLSSFDHFDMLRKQIT
jgi:putative ABC transport system permease protein